MMAITTNSSINVKALNGHARLEAVPGRRPNALVWDGDCFMGVRKVGLYETRCELQNANAPVGRNKLDMRPP